jgi:hypothetical protein
MCPKAPPSTENRTAPNLHGEDKANMLTYLHGSPLVQGDDPRHGRGESHG